VKFSKDQQKQNDTSSWLVLVTGHTLTAIDWLSIVIGSCVPYKCSFNVYCMIFTVYEQGKKDSTKFEYGKYLYCLKCNKKFGKLTLPLGLPFTFKSLFQP
jgi:hypothetical protein